MLDPEGARMRSIGLRAWRVLLLVVAGGDIGAATAAQLLRGTVSLQGHAQTAAASVLEVALIDAATLDSAALLLGSLRLDGPGASPIPFALPYDPSRLAPAHPYVLRAVLRLNGAVLYAGEAAVSVGPRRIPGPVHLTLAAAPALAAAQAAPGLIDTDWRVMQVDGHALAAVGAPPASELRFTEDGHVTGSGACNRLAGRYAYADGALTITAVATTRMACADEVLRTEQQLLDALSGNLRVSSAGQEQLELQGPSGTLRVRLGGREAHP